MNMKTNVPIQLLIMLLVIVSTACQPSKNKSEEDTHSAAQTDSTQHEHMAKVAYTCTMHPEVVQDEPGKCTKCGMELVKQEHDEAESDSTEHDHQH